MFERMQLAVFDMDGLTLDTERVYYQAQVDACVAHHFQFNKNKLIEAIGSRTFDLSGFYFGNIPEHGEEVLDDAYEACVQGLIHNGVKTKEGILEIFSFLQKKKIPICIATSNYRDMAEQLLHSAGVDSYVSDVVTYNDVKHSKPEPDIFLEALRRFAVLPDRAVVFEDSENGAIAANRAKIPYVIVPDLKTPGEECIKKALLEAPSMKIVLEKMKEDLSEN